MAGNFTNLSSFNEAPRLFDGRGNNAFHPAWGATGTPLIWSVARPSPRSANLSELLPPARLVSNDLFSQPLPTSAADFGATQTSLNLLFIYFGQFVTSDLVYVETNASEAFPTFLPPDDWARPYLTALPFFRSRHAVVDGRRAPINSNTAFLDAEQIYGNTAERAAALRTFSGGRLKDSPRHGLPFNSAHSNSCGCPVTNPRGLDPSALRFGGGAAANSNLGVYAFHVVFLREHNRQCEALQLLYPSWGDEQLYQRARTRVVALYQHVVMHDFLPKLVGPLRAYSGYDATVDPSIDTFFATAAFRYGHSALAARLKLSGPDGVDEYAPLRATMFTPIDDELLEPALRGLMQSRAQKADLQMVDDLRGFLYSDKGLPGGDMAVDDVQRGRDHDLPLYNEAREAYGLDAVESFEELISDPDTRRRMAELFGTISQLDSYVGMLAEQPVPGVMLGRLSSRAIVEQFLRVRDGDRFWFENANADGPELSPEELADVRRSTLGDVIARNTNLSFAEAASPFLLSASECAADGGARSYVIDLDSSPSRRVQWELQGEQIVFTVTLPDDSWIGIGFGATDGAMQGADIMTVHLAGASDAYGGCESDGAVAHAFVCDRSAATWEYQSVPVPLDTDLGGTSDLALLGVQLVDGIAVVQFRRAVGAADPYDKSLDRAVLATFAFGDGGFSYHYDRFAKLNLDLTGNAAAEASSRTERLRLLHAAFLTLAWGFMVPASILVARYGHHTSWFVGAHVALNLFAWVITWLMYFTAREFVVRRNASTHANVGVALLSWSTAHMLYTILGKLLKRNAKRLAARVRAVVYQVPWGVIHRFSGRLLVVGGAVQVFLGAEAYKRVTGEDYIAVAYIWYGVLAALVLCVEMYRRFAIASAEVFVLAKTGKRPVFPLSRQWDWHLFLSHVWSTGQDQMAVVKRRLVQLLPGWKFFLDVDNLDDVSRLEAHIDRSASVLFFISAGYFRSANCLREVRRATSTGKNCILLHEIDQNKGGLTLTEAQQECPSDLQESVFHGRQLIPWHRLSAYQMLSLRLVAESALAKSPHAGARLTYKSEISLSAIRAQRLSISLFVSERNAGASEFIDELHSVSKGLTRAESLASCDAFLLYLSRQTFTDSNADELADEVRSVRKVNARIFMVHENDSDRGGCPFANFFQTTPKDLIDGGLFHSLASPVFPTPHRELSLALAIKSLNDKVKLPVLMRTTSSFSHPALERHRENSRDRAMSPIRKLPLPSLPAIPRARIVQRWTGGESAHENV